MYTYESAQRRHADVDVRQRRPSLNSPARFLQGESPTVPRRIEPNFIPMRWHSFSWVQNLQRAFDPNSDERLATEYINLLHWQEFVDLDQQVQVLAGRKIMLIDSTIPNGLGPTVYDRQNHRIHTPVFDQSGKPVDKVEIRTRLLWEMCNATNEPWAKLNDNIQPSSKGVEEVACKNAIRVLANEWLEWQKLPEFIRINQAIYNRWAKCPGLECYSLEDPTLYEWMQDPPTFWRYIVEMCEGEHCTLEGNDFDNNKYLLRAMNFVEENCPNCVNYGTYMLGNRAGDQLASVAQSQLDSQGPTSRPHMHQAPNVDQNPFLLLACMPEYVKQLLDPHLISDCRI